MRRSGRSEADRQSFLFGLAAIANGVAPELDSADLGFNESSLADVLARGLALDHFARQLTEVGQEVTTSELVASTTDLARLLCAIADHAAGVISAGDLDELAAARDQARVLGALSELSAGILALDPTNGLGLLAEQLELDSPDGWIVTLVLVLWFRAVTPDAVETVTCAIEATLPKAKAWRQLFDNVPGLREVSAAAGGDLSLLAALGESHPEVRASLQRYLRDHPELADQLDSS